MFHGRLMYPCGIPTWCSGLLNREAAAVEGSDPIGSVRCIESLLPFPLWARTSVDLARDRVAYADDPERGEQC